MEPRNEAYITTWFFGLAHELGHIDTLPEESLSESRIRAVRKFCVDSWPSFPASLRERVLGELDRGDPEHVLSLSRLRSEASADIFATIVLLHATLTITRQGKREISIERFIGEVVLALNLIAVLERCKTIALLAEVSEELNLIQQENLRLHPVSFKIRLMLVFDVLRILVAQLRGSPQQPTQDQLSAADKTIDEINVFLADRIRKLDTGMARAMRFGLFPEERGSGLMSDFVQRLMDPKQSFFLLSKAKRFCELAASFEVDSEGLRAFRRIIGRDFSKN
jgi:hypothetical protein